jgi:hypothetical protein
MLQGKPVVVPPAEGLEERFIANWLAGVNTKFATNDLSAFKIKE